MGLNTLHQAHEFKILGPLEISLSGQSIAINSGKLRTLLVGLLLQANSVVSIDQLIVWLWDEEQPANPRAAVHTYVRRLRDLLGDFNLVNTTSTGYRLTINSEELDLLRFRRLVRQAELVDSAEERAGLLAQALTTWRGPVLADIPSKSLCRDEATVMEEERLTTLESWFETELHLGRHAQLVKDLQAAAIDNPFREKFWRLLMLALYRADRQAEALNVYQQVRSQLVQQLGIEPGDKLRTLHGRILKSDPSLAVPDEVRPEESDRPAAVPAQLPPETIGFVGRRDLIERLSAALCPLEARTGVPIVVLSGLLGVGKTALALRLGHRIRQSFPDGQLYVNLRGDEGLGQVPPLTPGQVLSQFLRSLGVPAEQIPMMDLAERSSLFRSKLAGKNVLVVLDDVSSIEQMMPLIPGDAGCSVLVTSRRHLRGLVTTQGAQVLQVDPLSQTESSELIQGMLRSAAVVVDQRVVSEVVALCANLPLALRIAAVNLINVPGGQIGDYLGNLRKGNRLAALAVDGDPAFAMSPAIAMSYEALEPHDRRVFRFAELLPATEFTADAVALLAAMTTAQVLSSMSRLVAANLVQQPAPDRYQFHDLLRDYAEERGTRRAQY